VSSGDYPRMGEKSDSYSARVGERLRSVRRQKRISLQDVEARSSHEFKASVLGAYERGERAISLPRLSRLAFFYEVPVAEMLPRGSDNVPHRGTGEDVRITIDLHRLQALPGVEAAVLSRFMSMIQSQRRDTADNNLAVRKDDLKTIACIINTNIDTVGARLRELGVRIEV
jgi:transcriptional regulator with XRE-family HTH domain